MAEKCEEQVSVAVSNVLRPVTPKAPIYAMPKFSTETVRIQFLHRLMGMIFNFLTNKGREDSVYSTRYSGVVVRVMLQYFNSDKFQTTYTLTPAVKTFLKEQLGKVNGLLDALQGLGDQALECKDKEVMSQYSALFCIEVLLGKDANELVELILGKKRNQTGGDDVIRMQLKFKKLDAYFAALLDCLKEANSSLGELPSQVYGALLIRAFLIQVLTTDNMAVMDKEMVQFLLRRKSDYSMYVNASIQIGRAALPERQYTILENHSPVFLACQQLHPDAGCILMELLTAPTERISKLSPHYLDRIVKAYDDAFA